MVIRFARNRLDSMMNKQILRKADVRYLSALKFVSDDENGEFYEMFLK